MRPELIVATKNRKKLGEIKHILKDLRFTIHSLADFPKTPRIVENGSTFAENAAKKAVAGGRFYKKLCMGEDSGLCVRELNGAPGVRSARFSGKDKSDEKNNLKLLGFLEGLPMKRRKAYYACAVALADASGLIGVVEGRCSGVIAYEPAGKFGFGYDPLFLIPEYGKTFGQLGAKIKHARSHRYRALKKFRALLEKYIEKTRVR
ncbi:MAG: RdgB/HAM1 family non-canonical purine NTP pyrophosphatase [Candidatus Omnitrophica bacterium]|jgi:XTP/dITP diphosphohydrolase|nr:RdgB/HAM1 family non-canonical purine NTP pyrophosphatase [Candidatus Omnitrophota bacterium]